MKHRFILQSVVLLLAIAALVTVIAGGVFAEQGDTERVSISSSGAQASEDIDSPIAISADGRYVAFSSPACTLVPDDTNDKWDVFVRDRVTGTTERVSLSSSGTQQNSGYWRFGSEHPSISADGRYVAFESYAPDFVPGDTNGTWDVFVRDREMGTTERVSVLSTGTQVYGGIDPCISADGRYVAFISGEYGMAWNGIYVRDRVAGTTELITNPSANYPFQQYISISADGRYVAFDSRASNLVPGDTNNQWDVFVYDRVERTTKRVSIADPSGEQGNGASQLPSISANGSYVAFQTNATNLVPAGTTMASKIVVHDCLTSVNEHICVFTSGENMYNYSSCPSISADGRYVAFENHGSVFVRDRVAETTDCVSISTSGQYTSGSYPSISASGCVVAFLSVMADLVAGDTNNCDDAFVHQYGIGCPPKPPGTLYRGNLHSHTSYSDGKWPLGDKTPDVAYEYARDDAGVDFLAVTDHGEQLTDSEWANTRTMANGASRAGAPPTGFAGIRGYEWTGNHNSGSPKDPNHAYCEGHINIFNSFYFSGTHLDPSAPANGVQNGLLWKFCRWLGTQNGQLSWGGPVVGQFNHPAHFAGKYDTVFDGFKHYPRIDRLMALLEVGSGDVVGYKGVQNEPWFNTALNQRWHVAPTNNQDNHEGRWGDATIHRTGVYLWQPGRVGTSKPLSTGHEAEEIVVGLNSRCTYASEYIDAQLYYFANGWKNPMGSGWEPKSRIRKNAEGEIEFIIAAPPVSGGLPYYIREVRLYSNAKMPGSELMQYDIEKQRGKNSRCYSLKLGPEHKVPNEAYVFKVSVPWVSDSWYFIRAITYGGSHIYAAPIWTTEPSQSKKRAASWSWDNPRLTIAMVNVDTWNDGDDHAQHVVLNAPEVLWSASGQATFNEPLSGTPPYDLGRIRRYEEFEEDVTTKPLYFSVPGNDYVSFVLDGTQTDWEGDARGHSSILVAGPSLGTGSELEDLWSMELGPDDGQIRASAGETATWEYTIKNDSTDKWLMLTCVNTGVWEKGAPEPLLGNPFVAPGAEVTADLYEITWDADVNVGFGNVGSFDVEAAWFADNNGAPGTYLGRATSTTLPYSANVTTTVTTIMPQGWNYFSIPIEPFDADASAIFGSVANQVTRWDPIHQSYTLYPYDFTQIEVGNGYVLNVPANMTISYAGTPNVADFEIPLAIGNNHIGQPFNHSTLLTDCIIRDDLTGDTRTPAEDKAAGGGAWVNWNLVWWDTQYHTWRTTGLPGTNPDDYMLRPWHGYQMWCFRGDLTLIVPVGEEE